MDIAVFADPVKIGPGIWFSMHVYALQATNDKMKEAFSLYVNTLCDNFKCKKCQPHFRKFIDDHPFYQYKYIYDAVGRDIGFFKWTWELHNQVNRFLKKYEPTLQEAFDYYSNSEAGACFNCGGEDKKEDNITRAVPPILQLYQQKAIQPRPFK